MCGIAGYFAPDGINEDQATVLLRAMTSAVRHRGPDDSGDWIDGAAGIALGHVRLAILDLSPAGHQPMHSASGRYVISFNGEIYNFRALRTTLERLGHRFRSQSDTEVLLTAVDQWGLRDAVQHLNGMFAFALWDRTERVLHLVRDRAGEKPLYYGWMGDTFLFGSELKALRAHPVFRAEIDRDALTLFLRYGYVPGPHTIYRRVYKLPPATLVSIDRTQVGRPPVPEAYWRARDAAQCGMAQPFSGSADEAVDQADELLRDAVKLRMEADVPLGAFLSGGIDSSAIVALMQAQSARPVRTFSIGFREDRYNEAPYAAAVARHLGTDHTELYVTAQDALAVIPSLPALYDEPFADVSQIPTYLVSALTRRHVTVSLSGDGGDELFGGYQRYLMGRTIWNSIRWIPASIRRRMAWALAEPRIRDTALVSLLTPLARGVTGKRSLSERMGQLADFLAAPSPAALYDRMSSLWRTPSAVVLGASATPEGQPLALGNHSMLHEMMYADLVMHLPDQILVKVDRASMAVSLEARVPLLDHRVIEFAWRLPLSLKVRSGEGKWLLRQVLYRYVPKTLVTRPKRGFDVPIGVWLRGPLRDWAEALLDRRRLRGDGILNAYPIRAKWTAHLAGRTSWDHALWTVLMFQSWLDATRDDAGATSAAVSQRAGNHRGAAGHDVAGVRHES